jgi:hypothetical protein
MTNTITKAREFVERMRPSAGCDNKHCGDSWPCHACAGCRLDTALDLIEALTAPMSEDEALEPGTPIRKVSGYSFIGEVRASFQTKGGQLRYVCELVGDNGSGMLHIFNASQIEAAHEPLPAKDEDSDCEYCGWTPGCGHTGCRVCDHGYY